MKKVITGMLIAAFMLVSIAPSQAKGGAAGFFTGCCFGVRVAADYNTDGTGERDFLPWFLTGFCLGTRTQMDYADGKSIHFRDWAPLIPYAGVIFSIWNGVDGANGTTRADIAEQYGSSYY